MKNNDKKYCQFISVSYQLGFHNSFFIENGGSIFINGKEFQVEYIDEYHFLVHCYCYHIVEFFEKVVLSGNKMVIPGKGLKTIEYSSKHVPYDEKSYQKIMIPDIAFKSFLFSSLRIIRETLPLGMYAYDIKKSAEGVSLISDILEDTLADHLGTIISHEPLMNYGESILLKNGYSFVTSRGGNTYENDKQYFQ